MATMTPPEISPPDGPPSAFAYRSYVLLVLIVVYAFNFIDRQIVGILAVPIKRELDLSDAELGLMGGLAFALFYTILGLPVARLADRVNRVSVMTWALALWSVMTALCGFTHTFVQLLLARVGVGIGEAGGVAPAYSLICDLFPPRQRARALSVYSFGIPIGSALGIGLGGFIAQRVNWRAAFLVAGVLGVVVAPLLKLSVREPARGAQDLPHTVHGRPPLFAVIRVVARIPSFWGLSLGAATCSMIGYGLFFWMPSFFVRSFGLTLGAAALAYGSLILIGGLAGIWMGGVLADRLGLRDRAAYAWVPAIAFLGSVPFYGAGVLSTSIEACLAILLVPTALGLMWLGPILAAVQHLVAPDMRATASALFLFLNNLIGIGLGTTLIGALSDALRMRSGLESLRYAILSGLGFYVLAAAILLLTARRLRKDWRD